MSLDRHIVRLTAAMILAIIAYVAPSAAQAHQGHAQHGRHTASSQSMRVPSTTPSAATTPAKPADRAGARTRPQVALAPIPAEAARIAPAADDHCPAGCRMRCCGTMACSVIGILPGPSMPSPTLLGTIKLVPRDATGLAGPGPEAPPEPPRSRA